MSDSGRGGDVGGGVLSSDEDQEASKVAPPRQRSLKRKKYIFTNELSSEQLVSKGDGWVTSKTVGLGIEKKKIITKIHSPGGFDCCCCCC